jgi:Tol biopolymer transport system component
VDLGLPRDASSVDLTSDGSTLTFLTADQSVGFCGACGSGPPFQAIVPMGRTVGDFVSGDDPTDLKNSPYPMPAGSPDGGSIAYRDAAGDLQVQEMGPHQNVIGDVGPGMRNVAYQRLTDDPGGDEFPAWSRDGAVIVYSNSGAVPVSADGFSPTQEIWSVDSSGGEPTQLTHNDVLDTQPDVSSDGTVAFVRDADIWTMALDGSDQQLLEATAGEGYFTPHWSPDGTKLALLRFDPSERTQAHPELGISEGMALLEVVVLDLATNEITPLGTRVATDLNPPSWMPDGTALLVNVYDMVTPGC